jgi:hypothetical protein
MKKGAVAEALKEADKNSFSDRKNDKERVEISPG